MGKREADLLEQVARICRQDRFARTVNRHLETYLPGPSDGALSLEIHPDDQMLLHSLQHHQDASIALSQYFSISIQQFNTARQIMTACFGEDLGELKVLDFACGYGRLLRLLSLVIPPSHLRAAEIQPDALDFVGQNFGVQGILSSADPQDFDTEERFDFIWVASLFSHLPDRLFHAWLDKLLSLLTKRGVLCFSARSSNLLPAGENLPAEGIVYQRSSETTPLDAEIYGTAYVSERYVQQAIEKTMGPGHGYSRLPRALANEQDLYLVASNPDAQLPGPHDIGKGLWGWVDIIELDGLGALRLAGWAANMNGAEPARVEVRIEGDVYRVDTTIERADVANAFADPMLLKSGWEFLHHPMLTETNPYLEVSVSTAKGETALLYAGDI